MKIQNRIIYILTFGIMWIGLISLQAPPNAYGADLTEYISQDVSGEDGPKASQVSPESFASENRSLDASASGNPSATPAAVSDTADRAAAPAPSPTPTPEPTPALLYVPNDLVCEGNPEIHILVDDYLKAKLTCERESFKGLVTDINMLDLDAIQHQVSMVENFHNLTVYLKRGSGIIDYVVYYTYLMDIVTIETPVLAIDELFITHNEDGNFIIFVGNLDDETLAAVSALSSDQDVTDLINRTYAEIGKATAADDDLLAFWQRLYSSDLEE